MTPSTACQRRWKRGWSRRTRRRPRSSRLSTREARLSAPGPCAPTPKWRSTREAAAPTKPPISSASTANNRLLRVCAIFFILVAEVFEDVGIGEKIFCELDGEWFGVHLGVVEG